MGNIFKIQLGCFAGIFISYSLIHPSWHAWIHRISDKLGPVVEKESLEKKAWITALPVEHLSGTSAAYKPYNTVVKKIQDWDHTIASRK